MSFLTLTSELATMWETTTAGISSVSGIAQNKDWALWAERLMLPVAKYLWLFPDEVKSGEVLTAAQQGER
jgi:hypothetical protein